MRNLLLLLLVVVTVACTQAPLSEPMLIPQPQKIEKTEGFFKLKTSTVIYYEEGLEQEAALLSDYIARQTGLSLKTSAIEQSSNSIELKLSDDIASDEGYELSVESGNVEIEGKTSAGVFYGMQSLLQLMPIVQGSVKIPAVEIADAPRFEYRGMHLDVCRHFFNVEEVKSLLDGMALHKMNRFHWHLTDDQGWRIEIKKYPKLTEIGAWRNTTRIGHYSSPEAYDSVRYGGFYTQEQIKEVIDYAAARHIVVIPEIELPGHGQAALASYPELGCKDEQVEVWNTWGISPEVFCVGKESTYTFFEDVLSEVIDLFPSEVIHIGGDECLKDHWEHCPNCQALMKKEKLANEHELQNYCTRRVEKFVNSKGRRIMGWDEILEGAMDSNAMIMSWRGFGGGIASAKMKHDVVMTPTEFCYFDYYQADPENEPLAICCMVDLKKVYNLNPMPSELTEEEQQYIKGVQANLWTEYIPTIEQAQYMYYPRLCAMAEVGWTDQANKDYDQFMVRMRKHESMLDLLGLNHRKIE